MTQCVSNWLKHVDRRALLYSIVFFVFLFLFERTVFKVNYQDYLSRLLVLGKFTFLSYLLAVAVSLLCVLIFFYLSFNSSWKYKWIYFLVFILAAVFEYGYQKAFGRFSFFPDLQIASFTTTEQKLSATGAYFNWIALVPCIAYLGMLFTSKASPTPQRLKSLVGVLVLFFSFFAACWYSGNVEMSRYYNFPTVSLAAFARTTTSYGLYRAFAFRLSREKVEAPALPADHRPANNIVFIVDESMRGDHLSLNGHSRQTTPFLDQLAQQGLINNWHIAVAASTCSLLTHDLLITGQQLHDLPGLDEKMKKAPLIFQYAKAMRYKTHYLDGQMTSLWGEMIGDGTKYLDNWLSVTHFEERAPQPWDIDFEIANEVHNIIAGSTGNFIFVYKRGLHPPYHRSFPANEELWKPSFRGIAQSVSPEERPALENSYDNGIRYNSEGFFKRLVSDYRNIPNNTVIIYTGDHGQTLSEDGIGHTHCGAARSEAIVPLFIIGNVGPELDLTFKPAHANLFATMLDLMGYPEGLRKQDYAISLLKAKASDSAERFFLSPSSAAGPRAWIASRLIKFD